MLKGSPSLPRPLNKCLFVILLCKILNKGFFGKSHETGGYQSWEGFPQVEGFERPGRMSRGLVKMKSCLP